MKVDVFGKKLFHTCRWNQDLTSISTPAPQVQKWAKSSIMILAPGSMKKAADTAINTLILTFRQFLIEILELTSSPSLTGRPFCDTVEL